MSIIPDVSPKFFSFSAIAVGYLLIDDLDAVEQNALGNWLMLTAQVICTNAYYKQLQSQRKNYPQNMNEEEVVSMLLKMVDALEKEIASIKKKV